MSIYPILCILYWCRCQYILLSVFSVAFSVCLFTALELSVLSDTSHSVCTEIVASHITTKHYNVVMGNKSGSPVLRPEEVEAERVPADDAESSPKERFKKDGEARVQVRLVLFWAELEGNVVFLAEVAERGEGARKKWKKFLYHIYTFQTTSKLKKSKKNVSKMGQFWPLHQVENSTFFIYFFYPQPPP